MDQDEYNRAMSIEFEKGQAFARGILDELAGAVSFKATHNEADDSINITLVLVQK